MGVNTIAKRLNEQGFRTQKEGLFYPQFVHGILKRGVIFTGVYAFGKISAGKYGSHSNGTDFTMAENLGKKHTKKPRETWLTHACDFEPVISPELFEQARKRLTEVKVTRQPKHDWATYSRLLVCDTCGQPMTAHGKIYRCTTYQKYGAHTQTGCGTNQVKQETIDHYVQQWLDDYKISLEFATKKNPLQALYEERAKKIETASLIWDRIESFMFMRLADYYHFKTKGKRRIYMVSLGHGTEEITLPGCESPRVLEELLWLVESADQSRLGDELTSLESRHKKMISLFVEAPTKMVRDALASEAKELEERITDIKAQMTSHGTDYRAVMKQVRAYYFLAKEAKAKVETATPAERRDALKAVLQSIRLSFVWQQRGPRRCSVLQAVSFLPRVGDEKVYWTCTASAMPRRCEDRCIFLERVAIL